MEKDLISIVVPIYNVEKYLTRCIDSIIKQTYKNIEIILVDDGSPDNCGKICDEYAQKDNRIIVIHKENEGLSATRNAGIEIAKGKYIGFVDSDDYIKEDMYESLYNDMKKYDVDISICKYIEVFIDDTNNNHKKSDVQNEENVKIYNNIDILKKLLYNENITDHAWNKLYKTELFKNNNIRYPKGYMFEDIGTTYLLFEKAKKISLSSKMGYYYIRRESSILGKVNEKLIYHLLQMIKNRYEYLVEEVPELKKKLVENRVRTIKTIFGYICIAQKKDLLNNEKIKEEYEFYKKNFKKSKKYLMNIQKNILEKFECYLLYYNKKSYWNYYKIKLKIKKIIKGKSNVR